MPPQPSNWQLREVPSAHSIRLSKAQLFRLLARKTLHDLGLYLDDIRSPSTWTLTTSFTVLCVAVTTIFISTRLLGYFHSQSRKLGLPTLVLRLFLSGGATTHVQRQKILETFGPKSSLISALNDILDGRAQQDKPLAYPCFEDPSSSDCVAVKNSLLNEYVHSDTCNGFMNMQGEACTATRSPLGMKPVLLLVVVARALNGGHGNLATTYGLGADNLVQVSIATPDGQLRIINQCQDPDLFWALRGAGGGAYGVVLIITVRAYVDSPVTMGTFSISNGTPETMRGYASLLAENFPQWALLGWGGASNANLSVLRCSPTQSYPTRPRQPSSSPQP